MMGVECGRDEESVESGRGVERGRCEEERLQSEDDDNSDC